MHLGTAEFGHYYSYINTLKDKKAKINLDEIIEEKWIEFNDSFIRDFDPKNIGNILSI